MDLGPDLEMGDYLNRNDTQAHVDTQLGQDFSSQSQQSLQMHQIQDPELGDFPNLNGSQAHIDGQSGQGDLLQMGDGPASHEQQAHIEGRLGQVRPPQTYQWSELEMSNDPNFNDTQAHNDGRFGQGLPLQMDQNPAFVMGNSQNFHQHQGHFGDWLDQGLSPQMSSGFEMGNGSAFHGQQALPQQMYQFSGPMMSDDSIMHGTQVHSGGQYGQLGQGRPLQTSQHLGFDMGKGQNIYQQQSAFAGQSSQPLPPRLYQHPAFDMGNGQNIFQQQSAFAVQYGQALPPHNYHPALATGNGSASLEQQATFAGRFDQALPPQMYQSSGFEMGDGQIFNQHQAGFAGPIGHTPADGQDTNNAPPQPNPEVGARLDNCHIVVYDGAQWVELRCHVCQVNANSRKKFFENGCAGLRAHISRSHKEYKKEITSNGYLIKVCFHRVVPQHEIDSINKMEEGDALPIVIHYLPRR